MDAEQGARRLLLLSRQGLPPRAQWADAPPDSPLAERVATIRACEARGASVRIASVDIGDDAQLHRFLDDYRREQRPPIRGVVHAAGVASRQPLTELDRTSLHTVLHAKVRGGWLLHQHFENEPLDFFVLFSSFVGVLGLPPHLGAYAAANTFLDALAHHRNAAGLPALAIDWGPWESGMATAYPEQASQRVTGVDVFSVEQGLAGLADVLAAPPAPQVGLIRVDWRRWRDLYPAQATAPILADLVEEPPRAPGRNGQATGAMRADLRAADADQRPARLERYLVERLAAVLGVPPETLPPDERLSRMGLDSLLAVEVVREIERDLKIAVPVVSLLQEPTIVDLAARLAGEFSSGQERAASLPVSPTAAEIEAMSGEELDELLHHLFDEGSA